MEELIWHKVSEEEKIEIKQNAKTILEKFSKKLVNIKNEEKHFKSSISKDGLREQGEPWKTIQEFKDITMLNAPFVDEGCITAEKANWNK